MTDIQDIRQNTLELFLKGVAAADPGAALAKSMSDAPELLAHNGPIHIIAVGKAAIPMMEMARARFAGKELTTCLAITNYENVPEAPVFEVIGAAHPLPDENGVTGGQRVASLLESTGADDLVMLLLSGGGSALMPCPAGQITLAEKSAVTDLLLKSGADITEINEVRRALSRLKGGGFAELAQPSQLHAFILSDVPGDVLKDIASGPTALGSSNPEKARQVLEQYGLMDKVAETVRTELNTNVVTFPGQPAPVNTLVGSNAMSVAAMAQGLDKAEVIPGWLEGDVQAAASLFVDRIEQTPLGEEKVFLAGGETAVHVTGSGMGGRNQEMAFRVALEVERRGLSRNWVFLSGGTDGRDGPTDSAGGLVDPKTLERMRAAGIDTAERLADNDSYHALQASGDLVMTGGTGTNVADLQICRVLKD